MGARFRSWWQKIKQHLVTILIVAIILVVVIGLIIVGYRFDWTGFNGNNKSGKTLWDWLQLLFIPAILTLGAVWFTSRQNHDLEIAADNQREAALQAYLDKMSELLLEKDLRQSQPGDEVRTIANVRTLTVLPQLDPLRKRSVLRFLQEAGLIDRGKTIVNLSSANLRFAVLYGATLSDTDLSRINLRDTNLSRARLDGADLGEADLRDADLRGANLEGANLSQVDLRGAKVTPEQLATAKSLKGATMPDGSIHP